MTTLCVQHSLPNCHACSLWLPSQQKACTALGSPLRARPPSRAPHPPALRHPVTPSLRPGSQLRGFPHDQPSLTNHAVTSTWLFHRLVYQRSKLHANTWTPHQNTPINSTIQTQTEDLLPQLWLCRLLTFVLIAGLSWGIISVACFIGVSAFVFRSSLWQLQLCQGICRWRIFLCR